MFANHVTKRKEVGGIKLKKYDLISTDGQVGYGQLIGLCLLGIWVQIRLLFFKKNGVQYYKI